MEESEATFTIPKMEEIKVEVLKVKNYATKNSNLCGIQVQSYNDADFIKS